MQARANRLFTRLARAMEKQSRILVQIVEVDGSMDAGNGLYWGMAQLQTGTSLTRVRAGKIKPFPNAWYKARFSPDDGVLELIDFDSVVSVDFFAGTGLTDPVGAMSVSNHGWTHYDVNNIDTAWIAMQQIVGLQVRPTDPHSLAVDITPYPPLGYAGDTDFSLADYLPMAGLTRFVVLSLDTVSKTIQVTVSDDIPNPNGAEPWQGDGPVPFDLYDVDALEVNHNYKRSAAIRLFCSQTVIRWKDIFLDLRDFVGRRDGYLRLDDDDPTIDGLVDKLVAGQGTVLSRVDGDHLVVSVPGWTGSGWDSDAEPESPSAYDDEFDDASFDTELWDEYDSDTIETIVEADDKLSLSQASQSTATLTGVYQAIPAGDFTLAIKVRLSHNTGGSAFHFGAGFILWEDATDDNADALMAGMKVIHDEWRGFGTSLFTAHDTLGTDYPPADNFEANTWYYLRLRRDGTTVYLDWSDDGETWTVKDISAKFSFTPGYFGVGLYNQATGVTLQLDADFFRYRPTCDSVGDPIFGRKTTSYVDSGGDTMTGQLSIEVPTASARALVLKSTDDNVANPLLLLTDSSDDAQVSIDAAGEAVFNETGNAVDFRVETDREPYQLFVDGSNDRMLIGNGASHYAKFERNGQFSLAGNAAAWKPLVVPTTLMRPPTANAPGFTQFKDDGAGSTGIFANHFDADTEESLFFTVEMPRSWEPGSDVGVVFRWSPTDTGTGGVVWGLEYTWCNREAAFGNTTLVTVTDPGDGTAYKHQTSPGLLLTGSGKNKSSLLMGRVYRKAADGSDTYTADAVLHALVFYTKMASLGASLSPFYAEKISDLSPLAYWMFNEPSGTAVYDASGNKRDGVATGVTWGQTGIGDGLTAAQFDGINDYVNIYSTSLRDAFDGSAGSVILWAKASGAGIWSDGEYYYFIRLYVDGSNYIRIYKNTDDKVYWEYKAGGTSSYRSKTVTSTDWICFALTWNKAADEVRAYYDGVQEGATITGLGTWSGLLSPYYCVVGAGNTTPQWVWDGDLAHPALFDTTLAPAPIAALAEIGGN